MDIAAVAMDMKSAQIQNQASVLMLRNMLDSMQELSTQLLDPLLSLDVGPAAVSKLDVSV